MVKRLTLISSLTAILFIQQFILYSFIGVQLTFLLLFVYSLYLSKKEMFLLITLHLLLNSITFGGITLLLSPFMFVGYAIVPLAAHYYRRIKNDYIIALIGAAIGLIYLWILIIPSVLLFNVPFLQYLLSDLLWEAVLAANNFITILLLYGPLQKIFDSLLINENLE